MELSTLIKVTSGGQDIAKRIGNDAQMATEFLKQLFPPELHPKIFLVGGIVRDILTGRDSKDIDLVAAITQIDLRNLGFRLVEGKSTAPIMFRYVPDLGKIEVTLIPTLESLPDDLAARDFTCNAIALSLEGELTDPVGGERDLKSRTLRACSQKSFIDDPIRIFRAFRFEADGWLMMRDTEKLIRTELWDEKLGAIPVERFSREMQKALAGKDPLRLFRRMLELKVGTNYLPEIFRMATIPAGPIEHHPEGDLFTHSCQVLERVSTMTSDPLARFCAFFHDLGKLATEPSLHPKHHGHDDIGFKMAPEFCERLKLPTSWKNALACTNKLHGIANRWDELRDATKIRVAQQAIKAGIVETLPMVSVADKPGNQMLTGWDSAIRIAKMTTEELGIAPIQLEMIAKKNRGDFILQKRVEMLRSMTSKNKRPSKGP
jgi:tRNA nucleotidyltransferase (CCA-adding enzyme)